MYYAIIGTDVSDSLAARKANRAPHIARLQALRDEGRLLVAGPLPAIDAADPGPAGFTGSVVIAEFDSLAAAQAFADADPYIAGGVWREVRVTPFARTF